jgi:ABC-type dipeptide/oligopeptide/nickel transport system permease component
MFLPVLSLGLASAVVMRMTRSSMLEVLGHHPGCSRQGTRDADGALRHARDALILIVILGLQMGFLSGVVITEQIFGPGLGWTLLNGAYQRTIRSCRAP